MNNEEARRRSPRNRTLTLAPADRQRLNSRMMTTVRPSSDGGPCEGMVLGDSLELVEQLPRGCVDLLILDPPYNLSRSFGLTSFRQRSVTDYTKWLDDVLKRMMPLLKQTATVYLCGEWRTSLSIFEVASRYLNVRNRITWEREKGRGARRNWKNNSEDIWFCTVGNDYCFNVDDVKQRRPVIAPYRRPDRSPKDWQASRNGNFRDTYPSNLWTDISIPFWSMPENTDHPTQKSEKLLAKLILASSNPDDFVFDPFAGSGTSCVVAKKLRRRSLGIEKDPEFTLWALRRLELAEPGSAIQGYADGVFWPRNHGK